MKKLLLLLFLSAIIVSCGDTKKDKSKPEVSDIKETSIELSELQKKANMFFGKLPIVAENSKNPITKAKVTLGKKLYFDNRLSKDNTQSCNTCHNLDTYGVDNEPLSKGNDGELGGRNSPTTLNAALHITQFWDGREPDVEAQAGGPVLNPVEMAMPSEEFVVNRLSKINEYVELFKNAFPDEEKSITYKNMKKAIGAFERKLITPSKFDDYLAGDDAAINEEEKKGLETFINSGCTTCHSGALLGGSMYQKFGLTVNYWEYTKSKKIDNGRFDVTKNEADKYIFKVPSLRNITKTFPYFHDGSVNDLSEAVSIMGKTELNKDLTDTEIKSIVTFLQTLTGVLPKI